MIRNSFLKISLLFPAIAMLAILPACQFSLLPTESRPKTPIESSSPITLSVISDPALPQLTAIESETLQNNARYLIENWLNLAGLNKVVAPSEFPDSLKSFRETWMRSDRDIAPFLGLWHDDGSGMGNLYFLSIFPSKIPKQVCVLEFRPEVKVVSEILFDRITTLSTATVASDRAMDNQLIGSRLRTSQSAIFSEEFETRGYSTEILTLFDDRGNIRSFATQSPPKFPPEFPAELRSQVIEELAKQGCAIEN